jgi:hypothetical protein
MTRDERTIQQTIRLVYHTRTSYTLTSPTPYKSPDYGPRIILQHQPAFSAFFRLLNLRLPHFLSACTCEFSFPGFRYFGLFTSVFHGWHLPLRTFNVFLMEHAYGRQGHVWYGLVSVGLR